MRDRAVRPTLLDNDEQIVEQGDHARLLANDDLYSGLHAQGGASFDDEGRLRWEGKCSLNHIPAERGNLTSTALYISRSSHDMEPNNPAREPLRDQIALDQGQA